VTECLGDNVCTNPTCPTHGIEKSSEPVDVIARAIQPTAGNHGQLCPVWRKQEPLSECDCWVKAKVYDHAVRALRGLAEAGYEVQRKQ
jgi:hypothetical protein